MCGIVGFITAETTKGAVDRMRFMEQALTVGTLRGDHGTGVYYVEHVPPTEDVSASWLKNAVDGYSFVNSADFQKLIVKTSDYKYMVGHNRAATMGSIDTASAHPFQEGSITLVHNGTLRSMHQMPLTQQKVPGVNVDSHVITHNLAIHPAKDVLESLDGAFTLVWHDARDDSLNVARNSERPFHMAQIGGEQSLVFCSEPEMLHWLDTRIGMSLGSIIFPKAGQWLKFLPGSITPEATDFEVFKWNNYHHHTPYSAYDDDQEWYNEGGYDRVRSPGTSGNPTSPSTTDQRVQVGGRRKEIPAQLQEQLLELGMLVEDRLGFKPQSRTLTENGMIVGKLENGLTGALYNVSSTTYINAKTREWTVRPIAIKYMELDQFVVICRLVSTLHNAPTKTGAQLQEDMATIYGGFTTALGPANVFIPAQEYRDLTCGGCVECRGYISMLDDRDIHWLSSDEPLCVTCSAIHQLPPEKDNETEDSATETSE